jgi:nicotinate-nucleotide adenylyltransferase
VRDHATEPPRFGDHRRTRIGLLGGSFNPAHAGHRHVAKLALRRLGLDQVWLLVSPGNPLKAGAGMAPFAERLASARAIADGRRIVATGIEARLGSPTRPHYTWTTLAQLRQRFPRAEFVWIMGADNLAQFPHWQRWTGIAGTMPVLVLPRPGWKARALAGQAANRLRGSRRAARAAHAFAGSKAPAWLYLPAPENTLSATQLRRTRARPHKTELDDATSGAATEGASR